MHPLERYAPLLSGIAVALPVLIVKYPPMDDLPLHEAAIGLFRHWGNTVFTPPSLYFINLGHTNQLFSLVVLALSLLMPMAWATKVGVAAALFTLPVAAGRFADHLKAPRWTALLVAPIGLGWLFFWGLIQNIVGLGVLLFLLPAIDTFALRPTMRRALAMCGAMVLLHFAHQAMQILATMALIVCSVGAPQRPKLVALRAVPVFFSAALGYAANRYAWHFANWTHSHMVDAVYHTTWHKLTILSGVLFGGFEDYVRNLMLLLAVAPLVLFAIERAKLPKPDVRPPFFERLRSWRFEAIVFALLVTYFVAPCNVKSTTLIYHRALPPAWAILAISAAAGTRSVVRLLPKILCAVLPLASLLIAWPTFVDSHQVYSDLDVVMRSMEPGSAILVASFSPETHDHRLWNPECAAGYIVAERGGRSMFDYTQSPISIVTQRADKAWLDPYLRLDRRVLQMRPQWDFLRFRYFLLNTTSRGIAMSVTMAVEGTARLTASEGSWYLFESTLPLVPIDSKDEVLPMPPPPMLSNLLAKAAVKLQAAIDAQEHEKPQ